MPSRPNIICIMSDEHDPAVTGCYGDPLVRTPNLNRLAAEGITFDAAYCNSPLSSPSRLSFTAGKYVSRIGAWSNNHWLPSDDYPSLPRILRDAGYAPYLCGKQHYDATRRYGFIDLLPELNYAQKGGRFQRRDASDENHNDESWISRSEQFHPGDHSNILDHDRKVTKRAIQFLEDEHRKDEPFFLFAGYLAPHFPLIAPEKLYEHYKGRVPMPEIPDGLIENLPLNYQHHRRGFGTHLADAETTQRGRDLYWALTEWFDGEVGKVLDALTDSDAADNTVVIYTSDHGENKGDHGLWWKNCMYEHGARVPLIVSWPKRWKGGQRRTQVCSLVDLVQTIAEISGADVPDDWDGDSLCGLLENPKAEWKDSALSEYYGHNIASGITMLREGKFKYVYHARMDEAHGPQRELYDLEADPKEFINLANDPKHQDRIQQMHAAMVEQLGEEPDDIEMRARAQGPYLVEAEA